MTTALAPSSAPTRRVSAPSPACMPRRRARTQTASVTTTAYLPVDITVRKLNEFFRPGHSTFAGCVSIRGMYSPVVAGNRGQVVQADLQQQGSAADLGVSGNPLREALHHLAPVAGDHR